MENIQTKIIGGIAVLALILSIVGLMKVPAAVSPSAGAAGGTQDALGTILPNPTTYDYLWSRTALEADNLLMLGGATASTALNESPSISSFNTASSTMFSVLNPFGATSTAYVYLEDGSAQATSTAIKVGTTTRATGLASTDVSGTLINTTIPTSTPTWAIFSGLTVGSPITAGSGTQAAVVVGPAERVAGFATSTYGNAGAVNYTNSTGTYKIIWRH